MEELEYIDDGMWIIWDTSKRENAIATIHEYRKKKSISVHMENGHSFIPVRILGELYEKLKAK